MAEKLGKTLSELLKNITERELAMWQHYYSEPKEMDKMSLQIAQLTSVLANVNGNKTTTSDFILNFDGEEKKQKKLTTEERIRLSSERLANELKKM